MKVPSLKSHNEIAFFLNRIFKYLIPKLNVGFYKEVKEIRVLSVRVTSYTREVQILFGELSVLYKKMDKFPPHTNSIIIRHSEGKLII